jgi:hypothetical protein
MFVPRPVNRQAIPVILDPEPARGTVAKIEGTHVYVKYG